MIWTRDTSGTALRLCKQRGLPVTSQDQSDSHDDPVAEAGEASSDDDDIEGMEMTLATDQPMQPTGAKNQRPANSSEHSIEDGSINTNLEAEDTSLVPELGRYIALEQTTGDISSPLELTEYDDLATEFPSNLLPWAGHDAISAEPMLRDDSRERDEQSTTLLQPRTKDDRHAQKVTPRPSPRATLVGSPSLGLRKVPNPQSDAHEQLVTGSWLSDATLELLQNKIMQYTRNTFPESNILDCSFVFDPLFIELAIPPPAWPRRMQHPSIRFIFVPLHHREPGHWTLSMVDLKRSHVLWYDPLPEPRRARDVSRTLCSWFSPNSTPFEFHELAGPRQSDGSSCGYYVLHALFYLLRGLPLPSTFRKTQQFLENLLGSVSPSRDRRSADTAFVRPRTSTDPLHITSAFPPDSTLHGLHDATGSFESEFRARPERQLITAATESLVHYASDDTGCIGNDISMPRISTLSAGFEKRRAPMADSGSSSLPKPDAVNTPNKRPLGACTMNTDTDASSGNQKRQCRMDQSSFHGCNQALGEVMHLRQTLRTFTDSVKDHFGLFPRKDIVALGRCLEEEEESLHQLEQELRSLSEAALAAQRHELLSSWLAPISQTHTVNMEDDEEVKRVMEGFSWMATTVLRGYSDRVKSQGVSGINKEEIERRRSELTKFLGLKRKTVTELRQQVALEAIRGELVGEMRHVLGTMEQ
ncbi:hypothetical protein NCS56_01537200 [Fusarium sp. Ph1]|nr:hypothetical protein NCS56_01537200 [Fusarium sp. Ph1]